MRGKRLDKTGGSESGHALVVALNLPQAAHPDAARPGSAPRRLSRICSALKLAHGLRFMSGDAGNAGCDQRILPGMVVVAARIRLSARLPRPVRRRQAV